MKKNRTRFHRIVYKVFRPVVWIWLRTKMRFDFSTQPTLPDQFLLISNHVTNFDPFLLGLATRRLIYYVATEHIFSLGWLTKLIVWLVDPIPRPKAGQAAGTVLEIKRRLKSGASVGLFAEGNCSWDGRTASFPASTGKLVRTAGVPLVTCRIRGGYLSSPRWADYTRRGTVTVEVTHIWQPEELRALRPEEINRLIAEGIAEDAYATRDEQQALYPGKNRAEGIENALFVCPRCHAFGQFSGKGNRFACTCGLTGEVGQDGSITAEGLSFTTMKDWEDFQQEYLQALDPSAYPTVSDPDLKLSRIEDHVRHEISQGTLIFSPTALTLGDFSVPVSEMTDLAVRLKGIVTFSVRDGAYYEIKPIRGKKSYHGRKYFLLFHHLKNKEETAAAPPTAASQQKESEHDNRQ